MCCSVTISPLDVETALAILRVGQFRPAPEVLQAPVDGVPCLDWVRYVAEESASVKVSLRDGFLNLRISPVIHRYEHHARLRIAGSIYFEIAAKYAEKVGGTIAQHQNVVGCTVGQTQSLLLAEYPHVPLQWDRVCAGFREVLLGNGVVIS